MRPNIPRSGVVNSAFRLLQNRLDGVQKGINAAAAREMKVGKYDDAQQWMGVGRSVAEFAQRVEAFEQEWKRLVKTARLVVRPLRCPLSTQGLLTRIVPAHQHGSSVSRP